MAPHSDHRGPHKLHQYAKKVQLAGLLLAASGLAACGTTDDSETESAPASTAMENPAASLLPDKKLSKTACDESSALRTTLYGALSGDVEWRHADMQCEAMPRPDGAGARLRFAGRVGEDAIPIAFIIAMPDLERGIDASEIASNVTVIEESSARFFSTPDLESCWTDIEWNAVPGEDGDRFVVGGVLYCISPLPEVNGDASISITEMRFSGLLDWTAT